MRTEKVTGVGIDANADNVYADCRRDSETSFKGVIHQGVSDMRVGSSSPPIPYSPYY